MSELNNSDVENKPKMSISRSFYELITKSPMGAISSIAALFIVIILSITIPILFTPKSNCTK